MDIREIRYIVELANTRNMTKAATNLYISQSALSKSLKKVEQELGMPLFFREGNTMNPTDAGKLLVEKGREIIQGFQTLETQLQEIKSMKRGKVILGVPPVIVAIDFPDIIMRFRRHFPGITLEIREFGARYLESMVAEGTLDVAISMRPILSEELNEIPIIQDQILCAMNADHPLAGNQSITIRELSRVPFSTFPEHFAVHQYLMSRFQAEGVEPIIDLTSPTCEFLLRLCKLSGEICVLPGPCIRYYDYTGMVLVPFEPNLLWELCIVYKKNAFLPEAAKALISCIQHSIEPVQF